ncbi:MAG TPA: TonB-dependent receptor, partial [Myxococcota bacterium]
VLPKRPRISIARTPIASAVLLALASPSLLAQEATSLGEVIVTAQKREQSLQDVPISIKALDEKSLDELNIQGFKDYVQFLPSVTMQASDGAGSGYSAVYMRGVATGGDGQATTSQPSVGMYLDEQPITTIQGNLDVHLYDVARVEALAGPQGTLYGASSQAGTIRIITNKPDPSGFDASVSLEGNYVDMKEPGYVLEGMVNLPLGERAAIRLVGWSKRDGGYIDNVFGSRTYQTATTVAAGLGQGPVSQENSAFVEEDYNDVDTYGARAALRIDLTESWTVTPTVMGQLQKADGGFNYDPSIGKRDTTRFQAERSRDGWVQAALTVEGKIANLDLTYAGSFLKRDDDVRSDYSDYSYFYDLAGTYLYDSTGTSIIDPTQYIKGKDRYRRNAHEIRIATPQDARFRFIGGFFFQEQQHRIEQRYVIDDLSLTDYEVTGWSDTIWLTEQKRVDKDYALFGEASVDIFEPLTFTGGIRLFRSRNSLKGYFGLNDDWSGSGNSGETLCSQQAGDLRFDTSSWVPFHSIGTAPCTNLDTVVKQDDYTPKVNLTYRFDDERMIYATWSKGFRPGGVNRNSQFPPYKADFLTNYELGFKTSWFDNSVRLNGAFFWEKWDDFQFSYLGVNGLTIVTNAGKSRIWGFETALDWVPVDGLSLSGGLSILDGELDEDFCKDILATPGTCATTDFAAKGTTLPIVPDYKVNLTGRYTFDLGEYGAFVQTSLVFQGATRSALLPAEQSVLGGRNRAYQLVDLSAGIENELFHVELFADNVGDERVDVARNTQCDFNFCTRTAITTGTPRTVGIRFGQKF